MSDTPPDRELLDGPSIELTYPLLQELPGAVVVLDGDGDVQFLNRVAELRLGKARDEVVDRDFFTEVLPRLGEHGYGDRYRKLVRTGGVALAWEETLAVGDDDRLLSFGVRMVEAQDEVRGLMLIEDRSQLAGERDRRRHAERLAAVGDLAAGAAHEINNPLASIKGFAQLLARDTLDRGQQQALEIISQECTRVARIVDNLLEFATQQRTRGVEAIDISAAATAILSLKRYALETSGIRLETDLEEGLSCVDAEKGAIHRLVLILIGHAEKCMRGREEGVLTVRTREANDGVALYVSNDGPPIPRRELAGLLETTSEDDHGLSLNSAELIVRDHGGRMWIESGNSGGTTVTVRLPRGADSEPSEKPAEQRPVRTQRIDPQPVKILIADDEPTLRLALTMFLGRHGYEIHQAEDVPGARKLIADHDFEIALIDARMPGDGLTLLDELDRSPDWKGQAVLMTGDHSLPRVRDEVRAGRPNLTKPFDMMDAVRLIEGLTRSTGETSERKVSSWMSS